MTLCNMEAKALGAGDSMSSQGSSIESYHGAWFPNLQRHFRFDASFQALLKALIAISHPSIRDGLSGNDTLQTKLNGI